MRIRGQRQTFFQKTKIRFKKINSVTDSYQKSLKQQLLEATAKS